MANMPDSNSVPKQLCDIHQLYSTLLKQSSCLNSQIWAVLRPFARFDQKCHSSQLTRIGITELESLGAYLNSVYANFLQKAQLKLTSTKKSRTIFSLAALLSKLIPNWCAEKGSQLVLGSTYFSPSPIKCYRAESLKKREREIYSWPDDLSDVFKFSRGLTKYKHPKQVHIVLGTELHH